jgi:hypothetical protein
MGTEVLGLQTVPTMRKASPVPFAGKKHGTLNSEHRTSNFELDSPKSAFRSSMFDVQCSRAFETDFLGQALTDSRSNRQVHASISSSSNMLGARRPKKDPRQASREA